MIIKVPMSLKPTALRNTENFIRDIACITQRGVRPFIRRKKMIKEAIKTYTNPFNPHRMAFDKDFVCKDPFKRYMHIDLGHTKDAVGIAMAHVPYFLDRELLVELGSDDPDVMKKRHVKVPLVKIDFWGKIAVKKGEEIILSEVRELIYALSKRHFYFGVISFDRFQCLHGSTTVKLLDGTIRTMEELAKKPKDEIYEVYSFDLEKGMIVSGQAKNCRKTGIKVPIYKVILDNNAEILCTDTHPFLMRNGIYKQVKELIVGDSIMPFYYRQKHLNQRKKGYYEQIYQVNAKTKKSKKRQRYYNKTHPDIVSHNNHKIVKIEFYGYDDVYDLEVEKYHNFGLEAGAFVHNSVDSIQILRSYGYTVGHFSVDRTSHTLKIDHTKEFNLSKTSTEGNNNTAQQALKDLLYDRRLWLPAYNDKIYEKHWAVDELSLAQEDARSGKIDHPPGRTIDVEQALAAAATHCVVNESMVDLTESEKQDEEAEDTFYKNREEEIDERLLSKNIDYSYDSEDPRDL